MTGPHRRLPTRTQNSASSSPCSDTETDADSNESGDSRVKEALASLRMTTSKDERERDDGEKWRDEERQSLSHKP